MLMTVSSNQDVTLARQQIRSLLNNKVPLDQIAGRILILPHQEVQNLIIEQLNEIARSKTPKPPDKAARKKALKTLPPQKTEEQKMAELVSRIDVEHTPELDRMRNIFNSVRMLKITEQMEVSCSVEPEIASLYQQFKLLPFEDCVIEILSAMASISKQEAHQYMTQFGAEVIRHGESIQLP